MFYKGKEVNIDVVYDDKEYDYDQIPKFDEIMEYFKNLMQLMRD